MSAATVNNAVLQSRYIALVQGLTTKFYESLEDTSEGPLGILFENVRSEGRSEDYDWLEDFAFVREWIGERQFDDFKAYNYRLENKDWEVSLAVDRNDIEDGRLSMYERRIQRLPLAFGYHKRKLMADLLNNGFTDSGYDGVAFFATTHPYFALDSKAASTQSNKGTAALTANESGVSALKTAWNAMRDFRAGNGRRISITPDTLIVPTALEWVAAELIQNDMIKNDAGTLMVPNPIKGRITNLIVEPELTSSTAWFLADTDNPLIKPFIFQMRQDVQFQAFTDPSNSELVFTQKKYLFGADARYNVGYALPHVIYGSTGTG